MSRSNNSWQQFHENNHPSTMQTLSGDTATDHVTTVATTLSPNHSASNHLNRVTRPANTRRRSRASRKTPTTLLNTDTTNFRAMVQRFTGGADVTSTQQVLNTFNNATSSSFSYGVPALGPNETNNMEFRQANRQPYFTVVEDGAGGSATATGHDDFDAQQHMGFRQAGSFNW